MNRPYGWLPLEFKSNTTLDTSRSVAEACSNSERREWAMLQEAFWEVERKTKHPDGQNGEILEKGSVMTTTF